MKHTDFEGTLLEFVAIVVFLLAILWCLFFATGDLNFLLDWF